MAEEQESSRRMSHNGRLMREIVDRLRDYSVDEVRLICRKYVQRHGPASVSGRARRRAPTAEPAAGAAPDREDGKGE